jgi:hypothetical protein
MIIKKIKNLFKLEIFCNSAKFEDSGIGPNLSPVLARDKINAFCEEFNKLTLKYNTDLKISVKLVIYIDNSFFFYLSGPTFSNIIKILNNLNLEKIISIFDLYDIIFLKNLFIYKEFISFKFNSIFLYTQLKNSINSLQFLKILKN